MDHQLTTQPQDKGGSSQHRRRNVPTAVQPANHRLWSTAGGTGWLEVELCCHLLQRVGRSVGAGFVCLVQWVEVPT